MKKNNVEVSKEFVSAIEKMTKDQVYTLLEEKVTMVNESDDLGNKEDRLILEAEIKKLCAKYNELSKLTVFGTCAKAEYPVLEFAKTFKYPSVKHATELGEEIGEDGKKHTFSVLKIKEESTNLDLFEFLQWAEKLNRQVTSQKNWRTPCRTTRNSIVNEWKRFDKSNTNSVKIDKKIFRENLQKMYDALLFIPSPNNNNRVMATQAIANKLFMFSNVARDKVNKDGDIVIDFAVMPEKQWIKLTMYLLHLTVKDKDYAPNEVEVKFNFEEAETEAESK